MRVTTITALLAPLSQNCGHTFPKANSCPVLFPDNVSARLDPLAVFRCWCMEGHRLVREGEVTREFRETLDPRFVLRDLAAVEVCGIAEHVAIFAVGSCRE